MNDLAAAATWLKSTFLHTRIKKNPAFYSMARGLTEAEVEGRLQEMCRRDLQKLAAAQMVQLNEDRTMHALLLGSITARHSLEVQTAQLFQTVHASDGLSKVISLVAEVGLHAGSLPKTRPPTSCNCSLRTRFSPSSVVDSTRVRIGKRATILALPAGSGQETPV